MPAALMFPLADLIATNSDRPDASDEGIGGAPALVLISERALVRVCAQLGAAGFGGKLSDSEVALLETAEQEPGWRNEHVALLADAIREGKDPLGKTLLELRPAANRRSVGAFYTPPALVGPIVDWAIKQRPARVVDAGCGSGRFAAAVARAQPEVEIVAVDLDPLATLITRATLAVLGATHAIVLQADYTRLRLPDVSGRTAFIGNPPYVRHHALPSSAKRWIVETSELLGHRASALAGLHAHFFVATAVLAHDGDVGCFVTSSEWLDVGYGSVVRHLLVNGLGGRALHLIKPTAITFEDAQTTAVITCFQKGFRASSVAVQLVEHVAMLVELEHGPRIDMDAFAKSDRWTHLLAATLREAEQGSIPLGQVARVSRGMVTGGNAFFVMTRERARELAIHEWCHPAITDAKEVLDANGTVRDSPSRRVVLLLPPDFDRESHPRVDAYLKTGERAARGAIPLSKRYICAHRRPWWYLGHQSSPPIVASYMARQAPAFATNPDRLCVVNIAHGVYPRIAMSEPGLTELVAELNAARQSFRGRGRTYQGGLEKFEPREMEALPIRAR
jgi:adenine-specific DNA-methyltransferase